MDAYDAQFQYELSLCRPAITSRTDSTEFTTCFQEFLKTNRDLIHTVSKPCPYTLPQDCIEDLIQATDSPLVKESFQRHHENAILFEEKLSHCRLIELCTLSTPEDIRAGKVLVGTNYSAHEHHPVYTPESYAKHLQHILELMGYTGIRRTKTQLQIKELIQELRR